MTIKEYTLTKEDYDFLIEAMKQTSIFPDNVRAKLNSAWAELGKKYGFNPWTVKQDKLSYYKFTAEEI